MGRFLARRMLQFLAVFIGLTLFLHAMVFVLPGDPIRALFGFRLPPPGVVTQLRAVYHLDEPWIVQYGLYLADLVRGDLGNTYTGASVSGILRANAVPTLTLVGMAVVIQMVLGVGLGVVTALRHGRWLDHASNLVTVVLLAIPVFVLASLARKFIALDLGLFPVAGVVEGWYSYVLPALVLATGSLVSIARVTRYGLSDSLRAEYARTALAKGMPRGRIVGIHALRNSLVPVVTLVGAEAGALLTGAVIVESIFLLPGIGTIAVNGLRAQEGPIVIGVVTVLLIGISVVNLVVDLLYAALDPRIRVT